MLTIFTPTYNRAETLGRLYESLCRQKLKNFEWIVVDDGSSDDTEKLITNILAANQGFEIKFHRQNHGGKHRAINYGLKKAQGQFFFIVDSDDYLIEQATSIIEEWIQNIHDDETLAGVAGLRVDEKGNQIGEYPDNASLYIDESNLKRYKRKLNGDKAEIYKTDLLRKYPFPEFEGETFLTERVVWDRIAHDGYKIRWYNKKIYICEYRQDGLTRTGANTTKGHLDNFAGYCLFVSQSLKLCDAEEAVTIFREFLITVKAKKFSLSEKAEIIGLNCLEYTYWSVLKIPFWYVVRIIRRIVK